jgi:hypothetical protein
MKQDDLALAITDAVIDAIKTVLPAIVADECRKQVAQLPAPLDAASITAMIAGEIARALEAPRPRARKNGNGHAPRADA